METIEKTDRHLSERLGPAFNGVEENAIEIAKPVCEAEPRARGEN